MLILDGVSFSYRQPVLVDVDLRLEAEARTGLVGINGAGKSTLLTIAAGGRRPARGRVSVQGASLYGPGRGSALARVAYMPQNPVFPAGMTALEIVEYLTWMRGHSRARARRRARTALDQVGLGAQQRTRYGRLSGGMRRRVALAQALAPEAEVVLLDEPSTGLDPQQRRLMVDILRQLPGCVLMSSHVMEDITAATSHLVVLHDGRKLFDGPMTEFTSTRTGAPEHAAERAFLDLISRA